MCIFRTVSLFNLFENNQKQASKQTNKQANKQTSKQANKQTNKQTNIMIITLLPSRAALRAFPRPRCSSIRSTIQFVALLRSHSSLSIRQTWERTYQSACEHAHHHPINAYQLLTFANILLCGVFLGPLSSCLQVLLIVVAVNYRDFVVLH